MRFNFLSASMLDEATKKEKTKKNTLLNRIVFFVFLLFYNGIFKRILWVNCLLRIVFRHFINVPEINLI